MSYKEAMDLISKKNLLSWQGQGSSLCYSNTFPADVSSSATKNPCQFQARFLPAESECNGATE